MYSLVVFPGLPYLPKLFNKATINIPHPKNLFTKVIALYLLTSQTNEPWCEEPTSYTSTTGALVAHLHLFVSFPAKFKGNDYTIREFTEIWCKDQESVICNIYQRNVSIYYCLQDLHPFCQVLSVDEFQGEIVLGRQISYKTDFCLKKPSKTKYNTEGVSH